MIKKGNELERRHAVSGSSSSLNFGRGFIACFKAMVPVELDAQLDDRVLQLSGPSPPNLLGPVGAYRIQEFSVLVISEVGFTSTGARGVQGFYDIS